MLHRSRFWSVVDVAVAEALAYKLTQQTWTGCTAFRLGTYVYTNDATGPDGAQEYAVLRSFTRSDLLVQVETITFSWCSEDRALALIQQINANEFDSQLLAKVPAIRFQTAAEHGSCHLCV